MGEIISIREQVGPFEFRIAYTTGVEHIVTVDRNKRALFEIGKQGEKRSIACPFLRQRAPRERICIVHDSRPELCRNYLCSRILVLGRDEKRAGRVPQGTRAFITEDRALLDLWNRSLRDITIPDDDNWEHYVDDVLTRAGYRVVR
jgi:hypothetical protein